MRSKNRLLYAMLGSLLDFSLLYGSNNYGIFFFFVKDKFEKIGTAEEDEKKKLFFFYLRPPFCIQLFWQSDALTHFWYLHIGCDGTLYEKKKKKKPVAHFTPVCGASEGDPPLTRANAKTTHPRELARPRSRSRSTYASAFTIRPMERHQGPADWSRRGSHLKVKGIQSWAVWIGHGASGTG